MHIDDPVVLIRLTQSYTPGMSALALYDATRGSWVAAPTRHPAIYAFAVHAGIVQEVYQIEQWLPAGSTVYPTRPYMGPAPGRWEFIGVVADGPVRARYLGKSVAEHLRGQNPIRWVNC
jgi:hypothetical protein